MAEESREVRIRRIFSSRGGALEEVVTEKDKNLHHHATLLAKKYSGEGYRTESNVNKLESDRDDYEYYEDHFSLVKGSEMLVELKGYWEFEIYDDGDRTKFSQQVLRLYSEDPKARQLFEEIKELAA